MAGSVSYHIVAHSDLLSIPLKQPAEVVVVCQVPNFQHLFSSADEKQEAKVPGIGDPLSFS